MKVEVKPEYYDATYMPSKIGKVVNTFDYMSAPGYIVVLDGSDETFPFGYWEIDIIKEEVKQ